MKSLLINWFEKLVLLGDAASKARVRQELLMNSDRVLADMGFDPAKLASGIEAWPWRVDQPSNEDNVTKLIFDQKEIAAEKSVDNGDLAA